MSRLAIIGAGDLGGAVAHRVAARDRVREIVLIDAASAVAAGKALDIQQSGPVEGFATRVRGGAIDDIALADVVLVADAYGTPSSAADGDEAHALLQTVARLAPNRVCLWASPNAAAVLQRAVGASLFPRTHLLGSAPEALASAVRALVALDLDESPSTVSLALVGAPPRDVLVPWSSAAANGGRVDLRLGAEAMLRAEARLPHLWPPAPYALASAAARVVEAIVERGRRPVHVFAVLDGELEGRRGPTIVPARIGHTGLGAIVTLTLTDSEQRALARIGRPS